MGQDGPPPPPESWWVAPGASSTDSEHRLSGLPLPGSKPTPSNGARLKWTLELALRTAVLRQNSPRTHCSHEAAIQWFLAYSQTSATTTTVGLKAFVSSQKETLYPLAVTPLPPTPGQPLMCLVCVGLPILDTSYKWNRTMWGLRCWLLPLSSVFKVYPHCGRCLPSLLLRLNTNSTVHKETTCCLSSHPLADTWEYVSFLLAALIPLSFQDTWELAGVILTSHTQAMLNFPGPLLTFTCLSLARLSFPAGMSFTGEIGHGQEKGAICECGQLPSGAMDTLGDLESH